MSEAVDTPVPGSVEFWALHTPERIALSESARALTWSKWNEEADRLAEVLASRAGVAAGDRVAVCMQNRLEWFVSQAAATKLGALVVPVSFRLTPSETHYIVADSGALAFLFDCEDVDALARVWLDEPKTDKPGQVKLAISVMRTSRDDVLSFAAATREGPRVVRLSARAPRAIVYTSGTTGRPRGVVSRRPTSTPGAAAARPAEAAPTPVMAPVVASDERNLLGAPLNHSAGQASARATLAVGGCVYIMARFDAAEALRVIQRERITTSFLVPTMLNRIVNLPREVLAAHDVSSIRSIATGASPCPQSLKEAVIAYFGPHCLQEGYGTSEVGMIARMPPQDHLKKPGSCGRLLKGVDVRIRDDAGRDLPVGELGEIFVKTPVMIERYLNEAPPKELVGDYFATGDVGHFDSDGYLYVVDRKKDMIIGGGVNIYPAEIENALRRHPAVLDVAVFGVPHPDLGETVRAAVECVDGQSVSEAELLEFVAGELASYKRPRAIDFMSELPRNAAGKLLKAQLRAPYWATSGKTI